MPGAESRFVVPKEADGQSLDRTLRSLLGGESWNRVRRLIESGKIFVDGRTTTLPEQKLRAGQRLELRLNAPRPREGALEPDLIAYVDADVVVVHKPAGISTVPYEETERSTLDRKTAELLVRREGVRRAPLGIVHRLDKETSGLIVFARNLPAKRALKNQFRFHTIERRYYAIANGVVRGQTFSSRLVQDRGDGLRGSTENTKLGRVATTHVKPLRSFSNATLLECRLETGRTHQIRIHLAEAGHPLVGERVYSRGHRGPHLVEAPRLMLHAFCLGFEHPRTRVPLSFQAEMPADMTQCIQRLEALST